MKFTIADVREIDDAAGVHYETVMTSGFIVDSIRSGKIKLENNIRPDWGDGKVMPKTKKKVERWAREILEGNAALGNLSIRLDPAITFELVEYEDGQLDLEIHINEESEGLDTAVDSQSRLESLLLAEKKNPALFDRTKRNSVRVWIAALPKAHEIATAYNTRGDRVNDSAAKFKHASTHLEKLVEYLVKHSGNPHIGSNNIEVLSNTVSGGSPKLVGYNTFIKALEQEWKAEPITQQQIEQMGKFISDCWTKLVAVRPEFGVVPIIDRQSYRKTSIAGTALSIYGVIGVIYAGYDKKLSPDDMEGYIAKFAADPAGDWMAVTNPLWQTAGVVVPTTLKDGTISLKTRITFQTRQETAKQFKLHVGLL